MTGHEEAEEALRRSEDRLSLAVESTGLGTWDFDPVGGDLRWDDRCKAMFGLPPEAEVDYETFLAGLHPEDRERTDRVVRRALDPAGGGRYDIEYRTVGLEDGAERWVAARGRAFFDEAGRAVRFVGTVLDITERKKNEEEKGARARQQASVAELGLRALAEKDLQALMDEAVALVVQILGAEYCEILELLPNGDALLLRSGVGWNVGIVGNARVGVGLNSQAGFALLSGEPVVVEDLREEKRFRGSPLLHDHAVVSGISVVIQGRERPFGVLEAHTAEQSRTFDGDDVNFLQSVANVLAAAIGRRRAEEALIEVREAERSRIARDMHDEALQHIIYALREIDTGRQVSGDGEQDRAGLEEAANALRRSVAGLRAAIRDLPLAGGDGDGDFVEQLESLVRMNRRGSPDREIELSVQGNFHRPLGKRMEVELLRIVQEALTNVRRHSEARRVSVAVGASGGELWAEVEDDGQGFDPETSAGMGTKGMRERARALGGDLKIESAPGEGTRIRFEAPFGRNRREREEEIRVLLVEDHASFRQAAASVFEQNPGFVVVGQAGSLYEARTLLDGVDVAVVDLALPDGYGGDLIKDLRVANPRAMALVLSASLDLAEIARAVESGAAGVLHKSAEMDEVVNAVWRLRAGESLLSLEEVVELLRYAGSRREQEHEARRATARLTPREKEVLEALADGLDGEEIARRLNISAKTERNHVASILAKLGVHSRLQALVFALRHGLVDVR